MKRNKIFVLDDDEALLDSLEALLVGEGYNVQTASDSDNVIVQVKAYTPDLIILDYLLPNKNGEEVVKELRKQSATVNIPIIMISASFTAKNIALRNGVNDFLAKPFDIDTLLTAVKRFTSVS